MAIGDVVYKISSGNLVKNHVNPACPVKLPERQRFGELQLSCE
jgi:hypothetical protein